ncbi:MAG: O-antigen ligase family protein [Oscillospiraceae bacterium]|nr:O-antigen ligase family protein [Oscillospiraceae bacterium]
MNIVKQSLLYRAIAAVAAFFGAQWQKSRLLGLYLVRRRDTDGGAVSALWARIWVLIRRVFHALKLDTLTRGSIFAYPAFWCGLTVAATPLIPTMAAAVLAAVTFFSLFIRYGADASVTPARHPANRFILLFALLYAVSIFTSVTPAGSLYGGALQVFFALFAVAAGASLRTEKQILWTLRAFAVSGALVAAYGVYQYIFGASVNVTWFDTTMFSGIGMRVYSTLDNPNVLSEYLLLVIPFSAALIIAEKKPILKLLFIGCLGVQLLTMALTFARGGWLGLILATAVFLVMLDRRFILLGIVGLVALYFLLPDVIITRLISIGDLKDGSTNYRLNIWLATLAMLRDFWLVGIGPGFSAFNSIYPLYSYHAVPAPHAHNLYLQLVCDSGITALVIFLFFLGSTFRSLAAGVRANRDDGFNVFRIAAISALLGFLAQSATDYSFYNYRVTLMFWAVAGLGIAVSKRKTSALND